MRTMLQGVLSTYLECVMTESVLQLQLLGGELM
jgi:hypothetical protein